MIAVRVPLWSVTVVRVSPATTGMPFVSVVGKSQWNGPLITLSVIERSPTRLPLKTGVILTTLCPPEHAEGAVAPVPEALVVHPVADIETLYPSRKFWATLMTVASEAPPTSRAVTVTLRTGRSPGCRPASITPGLFGTTSRTFPLRVLGTGSTPGSLEVIA